MVLPKEALDEDAALFDSLSPWEFDKLPLTAAYDVHIHANPPGNGTLDSRERARAVLDAMDLVGVEFAFLVEYPLDYLHPAANALDFQDLDEICEHGDDRLWVVAGGGSINQFLQEYDLSRQHFSFAQPESVLEQLQSELVTVLSLTRNLVCVGEIALTHLANNDPNTPYIRIDATSDAMKAVVDACAATGLPLSIHMEIIPCEVDSATVGVFVPDPNQSQFFPGGVRYEDYKDPNPEVLSENWSGFETLVRYAHSVGAKIVLEHLGQALVMNDAFFSELSVLDRVDYLGRPVTEDWLPERLADLFSAFPDTLWVALKWTRFPDRYYGAGQKSMPTLGSFFTQPGGLGPTRLRDRWRDLFSDYRDRFLVGSDDKVEADGQPTVLSGRMWSSWAFLVEVIGEIDASLVDQIATRNPQALYFPDEIDSPTISGTIDWWNWIRQPTSLADLPIVWR